LPSSTEAPPPCHPGRCRCPPRHRPSRRPNMFDLFIWTTRPFPDRLLMVTILASSDSEIRRIMQWSLATTSCSWNLLKTSCVYMTLHYFSMSHGVRNLGLLWRLALSAFNSSSRWHSKAMSNLSQNSTKANFRWMKLSHPEISSFRMWI
jgi:hypothetical protein